MEIINEDKRTTIICIYVTFFIYSFGQIKNKIFFIKTIIFFFVAAAAKIDSNVLQNIEKS